MPKDIITIQNIEQPALMEHWGSLTRICDNHPEFDYMAIRHNKFPFDYAGYRFTKIPFNQLMIINNPFI